MGSASECMYRAAISSWSVGGIVFSIVVMDPTGGAVSSGLARNILNKWRTPLTAWHFESLFAAAFTTQDLVLPTLLP